MPDDTAAADVNIESESLRRAPRAIATRRATGAGTIPYNAAMLFQIVQIVYWLALSTWFGGVLFVAMSAPVIFRIIRQNSPILPTVLSVNLENQHGTLLAGSIVAELLAMLFKAEVVCAAALFVSMIAQWFLSYGNPLGSLVRSALFVGAVALVVYDWRFVGPRIRRYRSEYIDHADEPEIANPAREQFDRYHRESVTILSILLFLLLGMVLFSADIAHGTSLTFQLPPTPK